MARLPASSTSAGGRSNVISRVPKPSFAALTKGATRMPYPHDEPPWAPQHTRALFRLFQTSAPPDFQRQLLECVAQRQQVPERRYGVAIAAGIVVRASRLGPGRSGATVGGQALSRP